MGRKATSSCVKCGSERTCLSYEIKCFFPMSPATQQFSPLLCGFFERRTRVRFVRVIMQWMVYAGKGKGRETSSYFFVFSFSFSWAPACLSSIRVRPTCCAKAFSAFQNEGRNDRNEDEIDGRVYGVKRRKWLLSRKAPQKSRGGNERQFLHRTRWFLFAARF